MSDYISTHRLLHLVRIVLLSLLLFVADACAGCPTSLVAPRVPDSPTVLDPSKMSAYAYDALSLDATSSPSTQQVAGVRRDGFGRLHRESGVVKRTTHLATVATNSVRYGPANPGPLADDIASTFRSGSYTATTTSEEVTLYRAYGGKNGPLGSYWTEAPPGGPLQSQLDSALNPAWGNTAENVSVIKVPKGTTIYTGAAAPQPIPGGGTLPGEGSKVYIPKVNPARRVK